jgi:hypothetical protein
MKIKLLISPIKLPTPDGLLLLIYIFRRVTVQDDSYNYPYYYYICTNKDISTLYSLTY